MKRLKGFTLVELVITIAIVIILSVISVPIYRGYVDKTKLTEAYALLGTLLSAQKNYYSEYGNFLSASDNGATSGITCNDPVLGVDARGNKYFTLFDSTYFSDQKQYFCHVRIVGGLNGLLENKNDSDLVLEYNITRGAVIHGYPSTAWDSIK